MEAVRHPCFVSTKAQPQIQSYKPTASLLVSKVWSFEFRAIVIAVETNSVNPCLKIRVLVPEPVRRSFNEGGWLIPSWFSLDFTLFAIIIVSAIKTNVFNSISIKEIADGQKNTAWRKRHTETVVQPRGRFAESASAAAGA